MGKAAHTPRNPNYKGVIGKAQVATNAVFAQNATGVIVFKGTSQHGMVCPGRFERLDFRRAGFRGGLCAVDSGLVGIGLDRDVGWNCQMRSPLRCRWE